MATTLSQKDKISIRLSGIVSSALNTIRNVRNVESAKKESLFQSEVAKGNLDYPAQLAFREKQLKEEKDAISPDPDFISTIESSITTTKKLIRYEKYRTKYYSNYNKMTAGKITAKEQLSFLEDQLNNTSDPDLKEEIQKEIVTATKDVTNYENTITSNLITRAMNDKTIPTLKDAISRVKSKRATASLNDNEEEVTAYDAQLSALNSQLSVTKVSDSINEIEINTTLKGLSPIAKLDSLNEKIGDASNDSAITINGTNYESEKDYWTQLRNNYLAGGGTGIFQNFSTELKGYYDTQISNAVNRDGFVSNVSLNSIKTDFDGLKNKPEVQPFINNISNLESTVLLTAVDTAAKKIITNTLLTGDTKEFQNADTYLKQYQTKYGVNTEDYRADLNTKMTNIAASSENAALLKATTEKQNADNFVTPNPNEIKAPEVQPVIPLSNTNKSLQEGSQGADVVKLQEQIGGLTPDGQFGAKTKAAVIAFQTANGLTPDGVVGTITAKKLEEVKNNPVINQNEPVKPVTPKVEVAPVITPVIEQTETEKPVIEKPIESKTYKVKAGDTISAIAKKYGVTSDKIKGYKSGNANKINIGEVLTIQ